MLNKPIKKAVFPAAGLGTRFLPATKIMPKEMLTLVDKPLIQHAIEEAREAGIEEFIIIINSGKEVLKDHFIANDALNELLISRKKQEDLDFIRSFEMDESHIKFVYQEKPLGLGHAVWCAKDLIGDEPFAVISCDDVVLSKRGCLAQMVDAYNAVGGNILAADTVPLETVSRYGILDVANEDDRITPIKGMVEKPTIEEAPSTLSIRGRYILQPEIFNYLDNHVTGAGGEIQLTDAIASLIGKQDVHAFRFDGQLFDCGSKLGYIQATLAYALDREDLSAEVRKTIAQYL